MIQAELGTCTKCLTEDIPIVNKKRQYCDDCNYKRLHGGKSKQEVYAERRRIRNKEKPNQKPNGRAKDFLPRNKDKQDINKLKKQFSIKNVSANNKSTCSDGTTVTQQQINRRYAEACDTIKLERDLVCQGTGRSDLPLSFSHTISRKRCKEIGRAELIWDPINIELESYHEPSSNPTAAHNIWESGSWEQKLELLNIERKLTVIAEYDPEQLRKIEQAVSEL